MENAYIFMYQKEGVKCSYERNKIRNVKCCRIRHYLPIIVIFLRTYEHLKVIWDVPNNVILCYESTCISITRSLFLWQKFNLVGDTWLISRRTNILYINQSRFDISLRFPVLCKKYLLLVSPSAFGKIPEVICSKSTNIGVDVSRWRRYSHRKRYCVYCITGT